MILRLSVPLALYLSCTQSQPLHRAQSLGFPWALTTDRCWRWAERGEREGRGEWHALGLPAKD